MEISSTDNSIRDKLIQFNNTLSKFDMNNLSPEDIQMFDELAIFCSTNQTMCSSTFEQMLETDFVLNSACENLCRLFALYGFYLEMRAARICVADKSQSIYEYFKYRQSYKDLTQCEMDMLTKLGVDLGNNSTTNDEVNLSVTKIAFIGSGPIPNSSLMILNDYIPYADIYNIDISQEANQLASIISEQILPSHLSKRMHFITQDITEKPLPIQVKSILDECQLIYLGAFVGVNELEKLDILKNVVNQSNDELNKKNIQYFIIRTAEGLWQVIIPKVSAQKIERLQANTSTDRKFLFQIKEIHHSPDNYGIISIIATNV